MKVLVQHKKFTSRMVPHNIVHGAASNQMSVQEIDCSKKLLNSKESFETIKSHYDAIIVGGGHNGLVCATYLANSGKKVLILEKRHIIGGAAVTEELVKGYKQSRCSYVLSLLRRKVIDELYGQDFFDKVKLHKRDPNGLTPTREDGNFLLMKPGEAFLKEIAKHSEKDSKNYMKFEHYLQRMINIIEPLLDQEPPSSVSIFDSNLARLGLNMAKNKDSLIEFYHFITSSTTSFLDHYFESQILKATLATDSIIGASKSPECPGSAYVLLHHIMGQIKPSEPGYWYYVEGGMGSVTKYMADVATRKGVTIALNSPVKGLTFNKNLVKGVVTEDNREITADCVITNCTPYVTFMNLMTEDQRKSVFSTDMHSRFKNIKYDSPVLKINVVVDRLPRFKCLNSIANGNYESDSYNQDIARNYLVGTNHLNSETYKVIQDAFNDHREGRPSKVPIIEMTIPSILDKTLVPKNSKHHTIGLFVQYVPYDLPNGEEWTDNRKREYANVVYSQIEEYCPGFKESIIFQDILTPRDLEKQFSLTGGSIFHGNMDLSSIFFCRPTVDQCSYEINSVQNLYSCSSGFHPGGGVMGAPGRNCAQKILKKF